MGAPSIRHHVGVDILLWILVVAAAVVVAVVLLARRALRPGTDPTQLTFDPALMARVEEHVRAGRKVYAIKELRDGTPGLGLRSAQLMVERMAARLAAAQRPASPAAPTGPAVPTAAPDQALHLDLDVEWQVRSLHAAGDVDEAVRITRDHTGCTEEQARRYVDTL